MTSTQTKEEPDWQIMNILGKSYLDIQQTRIACLHRLKKLEYQELEKRDLTEVTETNEQGDMKDWKIKDDCKDEAEQVLNMVKEGRPYLILAQHKSNLEKQENELLKSAQTLFKTSALWEFCERVKGLGPVAALTFLAYINPAKCTSASKFFAYTGLVPQGKLVKGERGKYNPEIKGRLSFMCGNTIMHTDSYYYSLYVVKKDYYKRRIDFEKKLQDKIKGTPAKINAKAKQWLTKLIISHAIEIIRNANDLDFPRHRDYLPPKPDDPVEVLRIVDLFKEQQAAYSEETKKRIVEGYTLENAITELSGPVKKK